jgi:hypothetical protein
VSDIHFQKVTSSALACDLTLVLVSMLNICSVRPAVYAIPSVYRVPVVIRRRGVSAQHAHLRAKIFCRGCIIAESAVIGLRRTLLASFRSIMTTWFCSPTFSRTQMKWSDSRVSVCHQVSTNGWKREQRWCGCTDLERNGGGLHAQAGELEVLIENDGF